MTTSKNQIEIEKLKTKMYKCIQLPLNSTRHFTLDKLYINSYWCGFRLSELPFHFELVETKL